MKKIMLGVSMLLASTCIFAQLVPTKQAPTAKSTQAPSQERAKPGSENKNNATPFKESGRKQSNRDANKANDPKDKSKEAPTKKSTQKEILIPT